MSQTHITIKVFELRVEEQVEIQFTRQTERARRARQEIRRAPGSRGSLAL